MYKTFVTQSKNGDEKEEKKNYMKGYCKIFALDANTICLTNGKETLEMSENLIGHDIPSSFT